MSKCTPKIVFLFSLARLGKCHIAKVLMMKKTGNETEKKEEREGRIMWEKITAVQ